MALDNTIAILSNISKKLDIITNNLVGVNNPEQARETVQKTIINNRTTGLSDVRPAPSTESKKKEVEKNVISKSSLPNQNISVKDIVDFLGGLPQLIKEVTKLDNSELKKFERVLSKISTSISNFAKSAQTTKLGNKEIKNIKTGIDAISSLSTSIKKISLLAPLIPLYNLSLLMLKPSIKLMNGLLKELSKSSQTDNRKAIASLKLINGLVKGLGIVVASTIAMAIAIKVLGIKTILEGVGLSLGIIAALSGIAIGIMALTPAMKGGTTALIPVMKFITGMVALAGATFLLGLLFSTKASAIFLGLAGVTAVLAAYTAITVGALFLGSFVQMSWPFLAGILKFAAWGLALTAGTMLLGAFIDQGWKLVLNGLGGVIAILAGYTLVALTALGIAQILGVIDKTNALLPIMKFALWGIFLGAMTIALGKFLEDNEWATAKAFILVSAIIGSTLGLAKLIINIDRTGTLERASKGLYEIGKFMAICEGLAAGLIFIGRKLKDHEAETAEAFVLMQGVVWSGFGLAAAIDAAIKGRGKSLDNAARAMVRLGAFMAIGEGLALGIVLIGRFLKGYEAETIAAFALVQSLVWSGFGLATAIDTAIKGRGKSLDNAARAMIKIGLFMGIGEALAAGIALIGRMIKGYEAETTEAFLLVQSIVWSAFGLAAAIDAAIKGRAKSLSNAVNAMYKIGAFMAICEVLAFGIVEIGRRISDVGSGKVWEAFGMFSAIIIESAALAALANTFKTQIQQGATALLPVTALMIAAGATLFGIIELLKIKQENNIEWSSVLITLGMMGLIVTEFAVLAGIASLASAEIMAGVPALALCEALAAGAGLVLFGVVMLTKYAEDNLGKLWPLKAIGTLVMMGAIVAEFALLAAGAAYASIAIIPGIPALALCEALAVGAGLVLFGVVTLTKYAIDSLGEDWGRVSLTTLKLMGLIVAEFGLLASAAGLVSPFIMAGAPGLALCEALAVGSGLVLFGVVALTKYAIDSLGEDWGDNALKSLKLMGIIVGEFGLLASAAGLVAPLIMLGIPALALCEALAVGSTVVLGGVVALTSFAINHIGKDWSDESLKAVKIMEKIIAEFGILATLSAAALIPVTLGIPGLVIITTAAGASIGLLKRIVDIQLELHNAGLDDKAIISTVSTIKTAVKEFVNLIKEVSLGNALNAVKIMAKGAMLSNIMDNVSKMTEALGSIAMIATEDGKIRPAKFIGDKLVVGDPVDIVATGKVITTVIKDFTKLLTEDLKALKLRDMVHAKAAMESLTNMLDPISNFVNALSSFDSADGKTLHSVKIADDGKIINGPDVNLVDVANIIATSISTFARTLFNNDNAAIWDNIVKGGGLFKKSPAEKAMGILGSVIEPISTFVDCISKFTDGGVGVLTIVEYDEKGEEKTRRNINVVSIAHTIAETVGMFVSTLAAQATTWQELLDSKTERKNIDNGLAIFNTVIDPVVKFMDVISKFTTTKEGTLAVIDAQGKEHITDFGRIGKLITDSVTQFVRALVNVEFTEEEQQIAQIYSSTAKSVTDPISAFVTLISKYADAGEGMLPIIDENGNKVGEVDVLNTTNNILNCTRAFKEALNELQEGMINRSVEISVASVSVSNYIMMLLASTSDKNVKTLRTFAEVVKTDTTSLKSFDDVLSKGSRSRIKNINDLTAAIEQLNIKLASSNTEMSNLKELFDAINNADVDKVRNIMFELSNINITVEHTGNGGGGGYAVKPVSKEEIIEAIANVLESVELSGNIDNPDRTNGTQDVAPSRVALTFDSNLNGLGRGGSF